VTTHHTTYSKHTFHTEDYRLLSWKSELRASNSTAWSAIRSSPWRKIHLSPVRQVFALCLPLPCRSVFYALAYWRRKIIFLRTNAVRKTDICSVRPTRAFHVMPPYWFIVRWVTGHAFYVIGFENIRIYPSTHYRIRRRFFFPLWRADLFFSVFTVESLSRWMRVDGSLIRKEKVADSKISGYVWTEPKYILANIFLSSSCSK